MGNCQIDMGLYTSAEESHLTALAMRKKILGENAYAVGTSYKNLGEIYWKQGFFEKVRLNIRRWIQTKVCQNGLLLQWKQSNLIGNPRSCQRQPFIDRVKNMIYQG